MTIVAPQPGSPACLDPQHQLVHVSVLNIANHLLRGELAPYVDEMMITELEAHIAPTPRGSIYDLRTDSPKLRLNGCGSWATPEVQEKILTTFVAQARKYYDERS